MLLVVDIDPAHIACELRDPLDLLHGERSQRGIHFGVLADDDYVHTYSSFIRRHEYREPRERALPASGCAPRWPPAPRARRARAVHGPPPSTWRPWSCRR